MPCSAESEGVGKSGIKSDTALAIFLDTVHRFISTLQCSIKVIFVLRLRHTDRRPNEGMPFAISKGAITASRQACASFFTRGWFSAQGINNTNSSPPSRPMITSAGESSVNR